MGKALKSIGKVLDVIKPFVSMVNPALGAAIGFASGLMQGKNPVESLMGAAMDLIPGSGVFKNVLGNFAGQAGKMLMDGMGGNSLLSGALNLATGKGGVTNIIGDLAKNALGFGGLTQQGQGNAVELAAQRMSRFLLE